MHMKKLGLLSCVGILLSLVARSEVPDSVRAALEEFQDRKLGFFMHWGLYSQIGSTESWPLSDADAHWAREDIEQDIARDDEAFKKSYYDLIRSFNPVRFRPGDWAQALKDGGFRYVILTTKHHDGFCLWDTAETDFKSTAQVCPYAKNANADIVRALFDACRGKGLGTIAYFSQADFHHPDYWDNSGVGVKTSRGMTYDAKAHPERMDRFCAFVRRQMLELARDYGPIDAFWIDGGWDHACNAFDGANDSLRIGSIIDEVRKIQPGLISVHRGAGNDYENVKTPEQEVPEKPLLEPWESCITMADHWSYHYDDQYKSPREIIRLVVNIVCKGGNLALGVGPMPDGRLPRPALERIKVLGAWLKKHGEAIYATRVQAPYASRGQGQDLAYTRSKDGEHVYVIRLWPDAITKYTVLGFNFKELEKANGRKVRSLRHLATDLKMQMLTVDSKKEWMLEKKCYLPKEFVRDEYADAFEVEFDR